MISEPDQVLTTSAAKSVLRQVKEDSRELADKLSGFEDAWHMIRLASTQLLQNVELANNLRVRGHTYSMANNPLILVAPERPRCRRWASLCCRYRLPTTGPLSTCLLPRQVSVVIIVYRGMILPIAPIPSQYVYLRCCMSICNRNPPCTRRLSPPTELADCFIGLSTIYKGICYS